MKKVLVRANKRYYSYKGILEDIDPEIAEMMLDVFPNTNPIIMHVNRPPKDMDVPVCHVYNLPSHLTSDKLAIEVMAIANAIMIAEKYLEWLKLSRPDLRIRLIMDGSNDSKTHIMYVESGRIQKIRKNISERDNRYADTRYLIDLDLFHKLDPKLTTSEIFVKIVGYTRPLICLTHLDFDPL